MAIHPPSIRRAFARVVVSAATVLFVAVGCGPGGGTSPDPAPTVEATVPVDGATNVSIGTTIAVTFVVFKPGS